MTWVPRRRVRFNGCGLRTLRVSRSETAVSSFWRKNAKMLEVSIAMMNRIWRAPKAGSSETGRYRRGHRRLQMAGRSEIGRNVTRQRPQVCGRDST